MVGDLLANHITAYYDDGKELNMNDERSAEGRREGEQRGLKEKDPGEMSTTDMTREPQETEEGKKRKCRGESVYMDVTGGRDGSL